MRAVARVGVGLLLQVVAACREVGRLSLTRVASPRDARVSRLTERCRQSNQNRLVLLNRGGLGFARQVSEWHPSGPGLIRTFRAVELVNSVDHEHRLLRLPNLALDNPGGPQHPFLLLLRQLPGYYQGGD